MVFIGIQIISVIKLTHFEPNFLLISRDELRDFKEEVERLKKLRGKGKRERKPRAE
jgi:hypothetical protein